MSEENIFPKPVDVYMDPYDGYLDPEILDMTAEAQRRTTIDGIPRYVDWPNKRIMKCDWELPADFEFDAEAIESHVQRILESQQKDSTINTIIENVRKLYS